MTAKAELAGAMDNVGRVQTDLAFRLATVYGQFASAQAKAERYRTSVLPNAQELYGIAAKGLQAQRAYQEARLENIRLLGDAWQAASEVAGLLQQESWPLVLQGK